MEKNRFSKNDFVKDLKPGGNKHVGNIFVEDDELIEPSPGDEYRSRKTALVLYSQRGSKMSLFAI